MSYYEEHKYFSTIFTRKTTTFLRGKQRIYTLLRGKQIFLYDITGSDMGLGGQNTHPKVFPLTF